VDKAKTAAVLSGQRPDAAYADADVVGASAGGLIGGIMGKERDEDRYIDFDLPGTTEAKKMLWLAHAFSDAARVLMKAILDDDLHGRSGQAHVVSRIDHRKTPAPDLKALSRKQSDRLADGHVAWPH
jgi:hypothetical protein